MNDRQITESRQMATMGYLWAKGFDTQRIAESLSPSVSEAYVYNRLGKIKEAANLSRKVAAAIRSHEPPDVIPP